jgi:hypothetical protein
MQHATGRVERPGESQEALDGKKIIIFKKEHGETRWASAKHGMPERLKLLHMASSMAVSLLWC